MRRTLTTAWPAAPAAAAAFAGCVLAAAIPAAAQAPAGVTPAAAVCPSGAPTQALSLQQALARALCNDPRTQQSWAQWQARSAQLQLEKAQAWPTVNAIANAGQARQRLLDNGAITVNRAGVGSAALDLSWLLFDFGQQRASEQAAQLQAVAALAAHDDTAMDVALATAAAFFALAEAEAVLQVLVQEARFTDDLLAQNSARHNNSNNTRNTTRNSAVIGKAKPGARSAQGPRLSGSAAPGVRTARSRPRVGEAEPAAAAAAPTAEQAMDTELERLQLRADQSRAALERRLARGTLLQARGVLAAQLGLPLQQELSVQADDTGLDAGFVETAIEPLLQEVLRDHPALRAARARLGAAGAELDLARRSAAPRITLQHSQRVGRDVLRSDSRDRAVGVQLEVPLFAGFARKHREAQAQAQLDSARAELRGTEQQVALQTWSAYQAFQTHAVAWRQARTYEGDAQALLAAEMASYRAGNSDLPDVLDAHTSVSEAMLARLSSLTALRGARVRLAAALGRLHQAGTGPAGMTR